VTTYTNFQDRKNRYIKSDPFFCPFCEGRAIEHSSKFESEFDQAYREIKCNDCGKIWVEIYHLFDIEVLSSVEDVLKSQ